MKKSCNIIVHCLFLAVLICGCDEKQPANIEKTSDHKSWALTGFEKADSLNPILIPSAAQVFTDPVTGLVVAWEERNVLNPTAIVREDKIYLLYRAQDKSGTSRIGLAISEDGLHFKKSPEPVFFPGGDSMIKYEWNYKKKPGWKPGEGAGSNEFFDGVEDPRIVETEDGNYFMTYTAYDGKTARLCFATSKDLLQWEKHGPVMKNEKYFNMWSKSGAVVCELKGNRQVAKKINGRYWMYFGDTDLFMASSDDLVNWEPFVNEESGKLFSVLHPRPGYFDSRLVEPGPFALLRNEGILLIYNASNAANANDPSLPVFTYAAGQALFDKTAPYKQIDRTGTYFIHPDKEYEKIGEVNEVCFVEGLVYFRNKWFLYYGTADSKVAVAVSQ